MPNSQQVISTMLSVTSCSQFDGPRRMQKEGTGRAAGPGARNHLCHAYG